MKGIRISGGWLLIFFGLGFAVLLVVPPILPSYILILLSQSLIYAILAMSLDILVGYTGLGSLGHAAFFAIGAYTTAILVTRHHFAFGATLFWSVAAAAGSTAFLAILALRATGIYFLMITLAIAMCVWGLAYRWVSMTGGDSGITGIPMPDLGLPWDLSQPVHFFYFALFFFIACLVLFYLLIRSPFGKTLVGIRDNEARMKVLGYNVWLHKYLALIIAGGFAGLAGNLYAYFNSFVSPSDANLDRCMEVVLMVTIGGSGTLVGGGIGALIIVFLKNMVSVYTSRWLMILSLVYVITALYAPEGIMGLIKRFGKRGRPL
jgi:branched-chain amino acid transport system permease protein